MTVHVVVAVVDSAVGACNRPFYAPAPGAAIRSFTDEVNRKADDNGMYNHPDDYSLMYLSDFDDVTGIFTVPKDGVRTLVRAKDVFKGDM